MFVRYFEQGYSPIPVYKNGKNPAVSDWSRFCRERASEELIEQWESKKDQYNIGLACGLAGRITVVDIDTDDPAFMALCPPSPIRRRGKKGEARVFKYNPNIASQSFPNLDILNDGRQFLVPPSIHPDTKQPYIYLTLDTLENMSPEDLPDLDPSFLDKIRPFASSVKITNEGRNNKLKSIVTAMYGRGEPQEKIVSDIYKWDIEHHTPRLFTDQKEGFKAEDESQAKNNALIFTTRIILSHAKNGMIVETNSQPMVVVDDSEEVAESNYFQDYPEPTGVLKNIKDLILSESERHMPNLALGGAIALMSVICANRFRFHNCWTNLYVLNLAPTGCIDGETIIHVNRAKNGKSMTIKKAWLNQCKNKMGGRKRKPNVITMTRGLKNGKIGLIPSGGVVHSGFKECIKLTSESNKTLILTPDHLIYSNGEWVMAKDMLGRFWGVDNHRPKKMKKNNKKPKTYDSYLSRIPFHPFAATVNSKKDGKYKKIEMHRAIYEAYSNNLSLDEFKKILKSDQSKAKKLKFVDPKVMDIHHIDFDHYNNDISNLACITKKEHQVIHGNSSNFSQGEIRLERVVKIESAGIREVFDVIDTPSHSFVANKIIIHNSGKSFPQNILVKILQERLRSDLIGFGGYTSNAAFIKNLKSKRERLDMVDEISGLFAHMKNGGMYQQAIIEEMCKVWSLSNGFFNATEYASTDLKDTSSCYNPCITVLGSSTVEGIKENISKMMTTKGLLPRFLIFSHENYGVPNHKPILDMVLLDTVCDQLKTILEIPKNESTSERDVLNGPIYEPINVAPSEIDAIEYFENIRLDFLNRIETERSEPIKNMLTRGKEQVMKLATIHAVGNARMKIEIPDLVWARKTFDVCIHNATPLIEETAVENFIEKDMRRVLNLFLKKKNKIFTKAVIYNRFQGIDAKKIDAVIGRLVVEGKIIPAESSGSRGLKTSGWTLK